jgi:hypothetical protein
MSLKSLLVSQQILAEDAVATSLSGLLSVIKETGEVLPLPALAKLDYSTRILAYLLGRRAAVTLGVCADASSTPDQIASAIGLDVKPVRECLSRAKGRYVTKTSKGYEITIPRVPSVCEEINSKRKS